MICLKILARGSCADDVNELLPSVGESTVNTLFHTFCENFVKLAFSEVISVPEGNALKKVMEVYARMGLPGAMGSCDCTHVYWDCCPGRLYNYCYGKEKKPTLAFEVVVDHSRRIHSVSRHFFGAANDKQIVANDPYPAAVMRGDYRNIQYDLYDSEGNVHRCGGGYLIVDGGYPKCAGLIDPMSERMTVDSVMWSEWMESVRKDVECTFGNLKVSVCAVYMRLFLNFEPYA
jgi:hypothetical protein